MTYIWLILGHWIANHGCWRRFMEDSLRKKLLFWPNCNNLVFVKSIWYSQENVKFGTKGSTIWFMGGGSGWFLEKKIVNPYPAEFLSGANRFYRWLFRPSVRPSVDNFWQRFKKCRVCRKVLSLQKKMLSRQKKCWVGKKKSAESAK
jgi:hypothetical protein